MAVQLLAAGDKVIFLLDVDDKTYERFNNVERLELPNPGNCVAYRVDTLLGGEIANIDAFNCWYDWRAYVLNQAALRVHARHQPDLIEFFDYHGVAYYALNEKIALSAYEGTRIAVRFHATIEAMDAVDLTNALRPDLYTLYSLERISLALADSVIVPSLSFYEEALLPLYPFVRGRQAVAVPPLKKTLKATEAEPDASAVLFYGRLFAIKGVDLLVDAAISWLRRSPDIQAEFHFLGGDSHQPPDGSYPYADYLARRIPSDLRARFHFHGHASHEQTEALLKNVRFAVFPNRYESFCYAVHEMYAAGVPVIVSDIPAFKDFFRTDSNCLSFDANSSEALAASMNRMWRDDALRRRLTCPYPVDQNEIAPVYHAGPRLRSDASQLDDTIRILVLIIADRAEEASQACRAARGAGCDPVILLRVAPESSASSMVLFGSNVRAVDEHGSSVDMHALRTVDALIVLQGSDRVEEEFLKSATLVLRNHPRIVYVSCWRHWRGRLNAYALPLFLDALPLMGHSPHTRSVIRTEPGRPLLDIFDAGAGEYAELKYLWAQVKDETQGLVIPRSWIEARTDQPNYPAPKQLSYLLNGNPCLGRKIRIVQYAAAKANMEGGSSSRHRQAVNEIATLPTSLVVTLLWGGRCVAHVYRRARSVLAKTYKFIRALRAGRHLGPQPTDKS
ncbi:glycosyltransferase family 4 protein [Achromobacter xylosoxidans]